MGLSIGGGLGPFGARIGTRGVSGSLGPVSASTGYGRSGGGGGCAPLIGLLLLMAAGYFILAWPYLLGTWLAVEAGAQNPSTTRSVAGWTFEVLYGAFLLAVVVAMWRAQVRATAAANLVAQQEAAAAAEEAQRQHEQWQLELRQERDAVLQVVASYRESAGEALPMRQLPSGLHGRPQEGLISTFPDVWLVEPRVPFRGAPPQPEKIEEGELVVTNRRLLFHGSTRTCEWDLGKMTKMMAEENRLLIPVSNRQTVKGLELAGAPARAALQFQLAKLSGPLSGPGCLTAVLQEVEEEFASRA